MAGISILWTIVIGILAGAIAGRLTQGRGFGIVTNLIVGLIGSVLGNWIYGLLGFSTTSLWGILLMSTIGALVLIFIVSLFKKSDS